ncbi:hypothetical protein IL306_005353 [Fusarium sp. DS 682]|nr:hypothetical protein IL306_005353 [Fusarium sp. DS 682]
MADDPPSKRMTVPLRVFPDDDANTQWAQDFGPCSNCVGCRPDINVMVSSAATCISCNKQGRLLKCSGCHDVQYCSAACHKSDWKMHKLVCKKLEKYSGDAKPSASHFRVILFPQEAAEPEFTWAFVNDKTELVIEHPSIKAWKTKMKNRYERSRINPLIVHALSQDRAMEGKMLGHAVRVASWQPPKTVTGHLEGFNETLLSLTGPISGRSYGPLVAFAYNLDSELNYASMDDMSTKDFRHLVDFFNNSDWSPTIGDAKRYPAKTIPALFLPDPFAPDGYERLGLSIPSVLGTHNPVLEVTVAAKIDLKQACQHTVCNEGYWPLSQFCPNSFKWSAFLFGPFLLELPWIGRNAILTDVHGQGSRNSLPTGRIKASVANLRMGDGIIVYDAFCNKIDRLHLLAYDEFMCRQSKTEAAEQDLTKENFLKFWSDLQSGKAKIENQHEANQHLNFANAPSPYNDTENATPMLFESAINVFSNLMGLLQNEGFQGFYRSLLNERMLLNQGFSANWDLLPGLVSEDMRKMYQRGYTMSMKYPIMEYEQEKEKDAETVAQPSDGESLNLAGLAAATLNIMQK